MAQWVEHLAASLKEGMAGLTSTNPKTMLTEMLSKVNFVVCFVVQTGSLLARLAQTLRMTLHS